MQDKSLIAAILLCTTLTGIELTRHKNAALTCAIARGADIHEIAELLSLKISIRPYTSIRPDALPIIIRTAAGKYLIVAEHRDLSYIVYDSITGAQINLSCDQLAQLKPLCTFTLKTKFVFSHFCKSLNLSFFFKPLRHMRAHLVEIAIASIFIQLVAVFTPLATQVVVDKVLPNNGTSTLIMLLVLLAVTALFQSGLNFIRQYLYSHMACKSDLMLGAQLYRKLLTLPYSYFQNRRAGDTVLRANSLAGIREFITGPALNALLDCAFAIIFLFMIAHISWWLLAVTLIFFPLQGALTLYAMPKLRRNLQCAWTSEADMNAYAIEVITSIRAIKSFAGESIFERGWNNISARNGVNNYALGITSVLVSHSATFAQRLGGIAIIYCGATLVICGDISVGQLIAAQMLAQSAGNPLANILALWPQFQQARLAAERINDLVTEPGEQHGSLDSIPADNSIEFVNVSFAYNDRCALFEDFNLRINPGERVAIIGRSGSGKSTLAKLMQGICIPERGCVLLGGLPVAQLTTSAIRRHIATVLQDNYIFEGTVVENIALSGNRRLEEVINAARQCGADEFIRQLPKKYASTLGEDGINLSGGQRQRLAIARALLHGGNIIILDEATSAMDALSEQIFEQHFEAICADKTVVIITHRLSSARKSDRIILLENGRIIECGNHTQLMQLEGQYYKMFVEREGQNEGNF